MKKVFFGAIITALLSVACYHEGRLVSNPAPLMYYQFKPTEAQLLAVAKTYAEAINQNLKDNLVHPGQYADYGVALAKLGQLDQANIMFNNEKFLFPNNSLYVDFLRQTFVPAQLSNIHTDTSRIDVKRLDSIPVVLTPEEQALQQQIESDPEYQRMQKQLAKEEKEQRTAAIKKAREQQAKAKAAERKAAAKEKERAAAKKAVKK